MLLFSPMRGDLTIRKTRTASGATAVQVVRNEGRGRLVVKHIGSAHDEAECEALMARAERYAEAHRVQPSLLPAMNFRRKLVSANGSVNWWRG